MLIECAKNKNYMGRMMIAKYYIKVLLLRALIPLVPFQDITN
jgi:hypothetical protein